MGSDISPQILFQGVLQAAKHLDSSHVLVVIATHSVTKELRNSVDALTDKASIEFHSVSDTIAMAEEPLYAVSHKKGSSLVVGIKLLKRKKLDAFISAGNTGALVASVSLQLEHFPGIKRPALLVVLPTITGTVAVLDVGGSVSCKAHHLVQFAQLGAAFQSCSEGIERPKVGLLNIGVEAKKGTSTIQLAYQTLKASESPFMSFLGNVEGRDLFVGKVDVLVTDGFTGNVMLKTTEGISSFIFEYLADTFCTVKSEKVLNNLQELKQYFCSSEYPGALICGVDGIVIKCHGNATPKAILNSILGAKKLVDGDLITHMKQVLEKVDSKQ